MSTTDVMYIVAIIANMGVMDKKRVIGIKNIVAITRKMRIICGMAQYA